MPKIALAQIEFKINNLESHVLQIEQAIQQALEQNADIIVFPELTITGYFAGDLIEQPAFQHAHQKIFTQLLEITKNYSILIILGDLLYDTLQSKAQAETQALDKFNVAYVIQQGQILLTCPKQKLPNQAVFDEKRYFKNDTASVKNSANQFLWVEKQVIYHIHIAICEDLWHPLPSDYFSDLEVTPYLKHPLLSCQQAEQLLSQAKQNKQENNKLNLMYNNHAHQGAPFIKNLIISLNASPFEINKHEKRLQHLTIHAEQFNADIIYVNPIGLCDEVLFDGQSMLIEKKPNTPPQLIFQAPAFEANTFVLDLAQSHFIHNLAIELKSSDTKNINHIKHISQITQALIYSIKSYSEYTGFKKVVLGLSGGVDSALVATLAVQALGADNVHAIMMPSLYTANISLEDAAALAKNLGITYQEISITAIFEKYERELSQIIIQQQEGSSKIELNSLTLENLQARIRGQILMAYSNQNQALLLATGNKSELAMGYCTLYGDMAGGFAPIKDLYKTQVYAICDYLNVRLPLPVAIGMTVNMPLATLTDRNNDLMIPKRILSRAPSAELKPNQKDQDSLPPYAVLDFILSQHIDHKHSSENILEQLLIFLNSLEDTKNILFIDEVKIFANIYLRWGKNQQIDWIQIHIQKIYQNEYKRRQGALGPKVNPCAFARDWRVPITNGFDFRKI